MKGTIAFFSRYLAKEFGYRKNAINVVAPGAIVANFGGGENKNNEQKRNIV